MKYLGMLFFLLIINTIQIKAQPSYNTSIAFTLRDENNEKIDMERFMEEYKIAGALGSIIPNRGLKNSLTYDEKTEYFIFHIYTVPLRFSFALYHDNNIMAMYLPIRLNHHYALDFKFRKGNYLFDFEVKNKEKLYLDSNIPYYIIDRINWKKQCRKLLKGEYENRIIYNKINE